MFSKNRKLIERFWQYVLSISSEDRIAIIYHSDADGLGSACVAMRGMLLSSGNRARNFFPYNYSENNLKKILKRLKKLRPSRVVIVDIGIDQNPGFIKELEGFAKVLIVDHHKIYKNLSSKKNCFPETTACFPN
ncbi:MAG: DHH family phosphoesterase [Candidatus Diapherotrites archaeon]